MNKTLEADLQQLEALLTEVKAQGINFLNGIENRATSVDSSEFPALEEHLNQEGVGAKDALQSFIEKFEQMIVSSTGPRYWGYVTSV